MHNRERKENLAICLEFIFCSTGKEMTEQEQMGLRIEIKNAVKLWTDKQLDNYLNTVEEIANKHGRSIMWGV